MPPIFCILELSCLIIWSFQTSIVKFSHTILNPVHSYTAMDPGSIVGLVGLAVEAAFVCGAYITEVKDASKEILRLKSEIVLIQDILGSLEKLRLETPEDQRVVSLEGRPECIACGELLMAVQKKLNPRSSSDTRVSAIKDAYRSLKWPLDKKNVMERVEQLRHYSIMFSTAMQLDQNRIINRIAWEIDSQRLKSAQEAEIDFSDDTLQCLDGTRGELLDYIKEWAESPQGECMFWLSGAAGTGKSTISRTISRRLKDEKLLGGSFCFKKGETDRANAKRLFPTLAKQLAARVPSLKPEIQRVILDEPSISDKAPLEQFNKLILEPFQNVQVGKEVTLVVVIDALDECQADLAQNSVKTILKILPRIQAIKWVKIRFFLTSRPELVVRLGFKELKGDDLRKLTLDDPWKTARDISIFLAHAFENIRSDYGFPESMKWPVPKDMDTLLDKTVPLFISAATLCRFIHNAPNPKKRLEDLLADKTSYVSQMAATYLPILKQLLIGQSRQAIKDDVIPPFKLIVGSIILLATPLSINTISVLLGLEPDDIQMRLNQLHSVLNVPKDLDSAVRLFHLSFRDFLLDKETRDTGESEKFWIDEKEMHQTLTKRCLRIMDGQLVKDISPRLIQQHPPSELQYACRYWTQHLAQCLDPTSALNDAISVLKVHFLHWMEAMSIMGHISEVIEAVNRLQSLSSYNEQAEASEFLHDARRFVLKNRHIAETAPLQLYSSALMFSPTRSIIRTLFANELKIWPELPIVQGHWSAELQTLEGHTDEVHSLCSSADGRRLASGSQYGFIKLWDSATGQLQQTLTGHSESVNLVNFSHDNQQLVSASVDGIIKLWDATTGELQQTFEGHSNWIYSVDFSPDNQQIASSSEDGTVKLWKYTERNPLQTLKRLPGPLRLIAFPPGGQQVGSELEDHTFKPLDFDLRQRLQTLEKSSGSIGRVAFSPDGQKLASSSEDGIITLWIPTADTLQPEKKLQSRGAALLVFSPDGEKLAAASNDIVELWDIGKGVVEGTCDGQSHRSDEFGQIISLKFSSDGKHLAVNPNDKTIRVWNLTNDPPQIFSGHTKVINSIVFIPGGQQLATASDDKAIKIWDLTAGEPQHVTNEEGVLSATKAIAFSPDGEQLATGCFDGAIKIWDSSTGKLTRRFQAHEHAVSSVAYSAKVHYPLVLASGSGTTVRLWDPKTGQKQRPLHQFHSAEVRSLGFLSDNRLVSGWDDGSIKVWDTKVWNTPTSQGNKTIKAHDAPIESIGCWKHGQLFSGSADGTCKLWSLTSSKNQPEGTFEGAVGDFDGTIRTISISPGGQQLAGSALNGPTTVWDIPKDPKDLEDQHRQIHERHSNWLWSESGAKISILDGEWLCLNGEMKLWLPKQYRVDCLAVSNGRIALGHPSGNVSFIMMPQAHA
ncbi:WD40-repeat-containing domain protein [Aspergillus carlsbadensis]|nr:WD40-repeat-containing domain protein [Aspergillus carlsbadensis]